MQMLNQAQATSPEEQEIAARRAEQIARLKNEQLLQLMKDADTLYQNTHYATLSLDQEQRSALDAISKEAQTIKELLNLEYSVRVFRGYQNELKKLLAALQPAPPAEAKGRRLIPIRAGATQEEGAPFQQADPLQDALNTFSEQIRAIIASNPASVEPGEGQEPEAGQ